MKNVHITFVMGCWQFKLSVPSMRQDQKGECNAVASAANEVNEVGLVNIRMSGKTQSVGWSLIFPLTGFRLPVNALQLRKQKVNL